MTMIHYYTFFHYYTFYSLKQITLGLQEQDWDSFAQLSPHKSVKNDIE